MSQGGTGMVMEAGLRRAVLSAHLTVSIGWIGAVIAYLALGIMAVTTRQPETIRAAWVAMELTGWYVIVPLALVSFASGVVMAAGTKWGLFRHYWVLFSLGLTGFAVVVLLLHMPEVSAKTAIARTADTRVLAGLGGDLGHPAIGLAVLLVVQVLNLYKPRGLTATATTSLEPDRLQDQAEDDAGGTLAHTPSADSRGAKDRLGRGVHDCVAHRSEQQATQRIVPAGVQLGTM